MGFTSIGAFEVTGRESLRKGESYFLFVYIMFRGKVFKFLHLEVGVGNTLSVIFIANLNTIQVWHYHTGHKGCHIS